MTTIRQYFNFDVGQIDTNFEIYLVSLMAQDGADIFTISSPI